MANSKEQRESLLVKALNIAGTSPKVIQHKYNRIVIKAKYDGKCRVCDIKYQVGDNVAWSRGQSTICLPCHNRGRY